MTCCQHCGHDRLLHDTWGCKVCVCLVSVVYLAGRPSSEPQSRAVQEEVIRTGNAVVREADRLEESHIRELHQRAIEDAHLPG